MESIHAYPVDTQRTHGVAHEAPTYNELYDGDWIHPGTTGKSDG